MTRQNRTLGLLLVVALLLVTAVWFAREDWQNRGSENAPPESFGGPALALPDPLGEEDSEGATDALFPLILQDAGSCLGLTATGETDSTSAGVAPTQRLLEFVSGEWGAPERQLDRWVTWHLRTPEGQEHRLHLEVDEHDGVSNRELHQFSVDRHGTPHPIELAADEALNPSDETINRLLKEGEVFYKETARTLVFAKGEKINLTENDEGLLDLVMEKHDRVFRCPHLKNRTDCVCDQTVSTGKGP